MRQGEAPTQRAAGLTGRRRRSGSQPIFPRTTFPVMDKISRLGLFPLFPKT